MADALCGPSNAVQNLKQHTQVDRSLQQDRLTGPRAPTQGFRTQDPRTGSLDAEFHAFENAAASPFQEPLVGNNFAVQPQFRGPAPSSWANDFQQLSISDQPLPAQQFRNYAPLVKSVNGGWHNEFMRQQQAGQSVVAQGKQAMYSQQDVSAYAPQFHYQGAFAPMASFDTQTEMPQTTRTQVNDQLADAEWGQAFEEAFQDAFKDAEQTNQVDAIQPSILQNDKTSAENYLTDTQQVEQIRIGSDAINYTEMKDRTADQDLQDASALSRVAGELLHNVQHDSSEKFQNSQFLDLMRKIRDRQVEVRNNDFETTAIGTSEGVNHSTTDYDILNAPDPVQNQDTFSFPNMNSVYSPRQADFVDYTFDSDQFPLQPRNQISDLHPGGKLYPAQSTQSGVDQMSGAVSENAPTQQSGTDGKGQSDSISAADFEATYDENRGLASRYQRTAA